MSNYSQEKQYSRVGQSNTPQQRKLGQDVLSLNNRQFRSHSLLVYGRGKVGGGERIVCKGSMCITMTMRRRAGKEPLIGTCLPQGPHSRLIGHPFTRQRCILLTANQPITGSITAGLLAARQSLQALHLGQGRRPCHRIITMMNTAVSLRQRRRFW